jgi:hypothetical protein
MSNENKTNYTAYNIYSRIRGEDSGEDAKKAPEATGKSIYAKNHNMFSRGVGAARAGLDAGFKTAEKAGKKQQLPPPDDTLTDEEKENTENKGKDLLDETTPDMSGGN